MSRPSIRNKVRRASAERFTSDDFMGASDTAAMLGIHVDTLYAACARGEVPHKRIGGRLVFSRPALLAWIGERPLLG